MTQSTTDLSDRAMKKFEELRKKMKLDLQRPLVQEIKAAMDEKIQQMLNEPIGREVRSMHIEDAQQPLNMAKQAAEFVDDSFRFINNLSMSNNLKLAIGLIISGSKTYNSQDLLRAIEAIRAELQGEDIDGRKNNICK